jgi:hypothetical protein
MPSPQRPSWLATAVSPLTMPIEVDREILARPRPAAAHRHTKPQRLACDLLEVIAGEGPSFVQAILDD